MSLRRPIGYLEVTDFDRDGNIINPKLASKPVLIMIQADFCSFCHSAKPAFQQLADEGVIHCMTIQPDGERQSEKDLQQLLSNIYPEFPGYPSYILYNKSERIPHVGGRSAEDLRMFAMEHI